ncbi:MAG: Hsp20/alpha crystallin family protein [Thermomicrobiales bacterium]
MATRFPATATQDMAAFRRAFDPFFAEFFAPGRSRPSHYQAAVSALPLDVYAQDDDVVVVAAVPGVDPEAIEITVEKNTVTLSGKTAPVNTSSNSTTWYLQELPRGGFSRTLTLPFEVDSARADATFDNGLLHLTLPKLESAKARQIRVKVSSPQEATQAQVEATATIQDAEPADEPSAV